MWRIKHWIWLIKWKKEELFKKISFYFRSTWMYTFFKNIAIDIKNIFGNNEYPFARFSYKGYQYCPHCGTKIESHYGDSKIGKYKEYYGKIGYSEIKIGAYIYKQHCVKKDKSYFYLRYFHNAVIC